jgi:hypothetical protein
VVGSAPRCDAARHVDGGVRDDIFSSATGWTWQATGLPLGVSVHDGFSSAAEGSRVATWFGGAQVDSRLRPSLHLSGPAAMKTMAERRRAEEQSRPAV